jgi:hypothetical protein
MVSFKSAWMIGALLGFYILTIVGCATSYKPPNNVQTLQERLSQRVDTEITASCQGLKFYLIPLLDEKITKPNLGIVPKDFDMFPVFLRIENISQHPIKVDLQNSFIVTGEERNRSMIVEEVIERIGKNDPQSAVGLGVAFGLLGGIAGATVGVAVGSIIDSSTVGSKTIEEYYHDNSFKPTLINSSLSGSGIVFYDVQKDRMSYDQFILSFPILNLITNEVTTAEISFKVKDAVRPREEKK